MFNFRTVIIILFISISISISASDNDKLSYTLTVDNLVIGLNRFSSIVLPGDTISITINNSENITDGLYSEGKLLKDNKTNWRYIAPEKPGFYKLEISNTNPTNKFTLNVIVMVPASDQKGEYLNGYHIGNYPENAYKDLPEYRKPEGFIEVTQENVDVFLSPHFQINQFLCKQQADHWPKYILLRPKILLKLEFLLSKLIEMGIEANTLFLMSAYRTPYYNAGIGNGKYSRHIYGDATDVYVDVNKDGVIDDLNKDHKASMADAIAIYNIVDAIDNDPLYKFMIGGLGKYKKTNSHTWNVHLDTRGYKARW